MSKKTISYKDAGVDIEAGNNLVADIKDAVKATDRPGVMSNIGGFGGFFDLAKINYQDPLLVAATDGVGTKLKIAIDTENYQHIGQDLVAMCVNDLVVQGAEPLFFLDYYATGKLDVPVATAVVKSIAAACQAVDCALIGGETAEMPNMYQQGDFDLAGFAVGAVERAETLPKKEEIESGDLLIGLTSSGVHANGFSLVRKIMSEHQIAYTEQAEFDNSKNYAESFLEPTKLYVKPCLALHREKLVKAFCHITGGGFTENLPRILKDGQSFSLNYSEFPVTDLFLWLKEKAALDNAEFFKVFNCGIGMVLVAKPQNLQRISDISASFGEEIHVIGEIN